MYRQIVGCLSRRAGKTYISNSICFVKALEPGTCVLIVSPNYSLTNISWQLQIQTLSRHGVEISSKNKTDREIHLENGSIIKFGSVSQADSLVGRSYDLILFDEAALDSNGRDCYNVQLRPTLDKENSKVIFISTPRGSNYFKDFYERGFSDKHKTWVSIHCTYKDNPRMSKADVEEARLSMSRAEFRQEYLAEFTTFEGQIYEDFDPEVHVVETDWNKYLDCEAIMGIDPGYRDATGALAGFYDHEEDKFHFFWDYQEAGRSTKQHGEEFQAVIEEHGIELIFVDSAAAQFREDLAALYDIPSNKAIKSKLDGISYVQGLVEQGKITVDPNCEHLIECLLNYRWDPNENLQTPRPLHDEYSHLADALRYAVYTLAR